MKARFDLMGGWTDAFPYYLKHQAAVINLQLPQFKVTVEKTEEYEDNLLINACYKVLGIKSPLKIINTIPRRSGLGGSSIVIGEIIKMLKPQISDRELINLVLDVEEEIGTRGGWQDIIGGMYSGIKRTRTKPDKKGYYHIESIVRESFLQRCILIDTGQRRTTASTIMQRYADGDKLISKTLDTIRKATTFGWNFLITHQYSDFARLMQWCWESVCKAEGTEPLHFADKGLIGYKEGGASGGGFILAIYENRPENPNLPTDWTYQRF